MTTRALDPNPVGTDKPCDGDTHRKHGHCHACGCPDCPRVCRSPFYTHCQASVIIDTTAEVLS